MNILFLSIGKLDDIEENGLYTDLLRKFRDEGHNVSIITPVEKKYNNKTVYSEENGVSFLRVKTGNLKGIGKIEKGISMLKIENTFLRAIKTFFESKKFDLVLYTTPPITFEKVISYIKNRDNAYTYLLLKDIFPQNAVDLQMIKKNRIVHKYFTRKERKLYEKSDFIGTMSKANSTYILRNQPSLSSSKVEVCPNSIEPQEVNVNPNIREKYQVPKNKVAFIYGGNIGKPQGVDFLIQCLEDNERKKNTHIMIVGSGTEFQKLSNYFEKKKPRNAKLLSQLPKHDYEKLVQACDVGLVFLDRRFSIPNYPSRILSYMQASMPVLAATDRSTDIGNTIMDNDLGYWCESNDIETFSNYVDMLSDPDIRRIKGKEARKYLEKNYTVQQSYDIIMNHFNQER